MTDKEIIIDGVNVSGCGFRHKETNDECHIALAFSEEYGECWHCSQINNCYYKQLKRLETENKRMKDIIKALKDTVIQWIKEYDILDSIIEMKDVVIAKLKAENERLKEEIDRLTFNKQQQYPLCYTCTDENCVANKTKTYLRILLEIKEIAEKEYTKKLIEKDCCECDLSFWLILDLITKAESEEV